MAEVIKMPRLSDTMEEGVVAQWLKKVGDKVSEGDILAEIETDKATMEFESFYDGTLLHIAIDEGVAANVDSLLCIIGEEGEDISSLISTDSNVIEETSNSQLDLVDQINKQEQINEEVISNKETEESALSDSENDIQNETLAISDDVHVEYIKMPRLSDTMEEGTISSWLKNVGDDISEGDILAEIETDKATMEFESFYSGKLVHIGVSEGETVKVDDLIAIISEGDVDVKQLLGDYENNDNSTLKSDKNPTTDSNVHENDSIEVSNNLEAQIEVNASDARIIASPLAKKIAAEKNIDLSTVQGSGDNGRIIKSDLDNVKSNVVEEKQIIIEETSKKIQTAPTVKNLIKGEESYEDVKNTSMRNAIAKRLSQSKFSAPHYYLSVEFNMDNAIAFREQYNSIPDTKISFNDIVIKACAAALKRHPQVNSQWLEDSIRLNHHVHIGVAVGVEDGLVVPVIKFADQETLHSINSKVRDYAVRAKSKKLRPDEIEGSTFTVSNLGMFGIQEFTSIINHPNSAILSVGAINKKPVVINDKIVVSNTMKLTLACDHRSVDGVTGSLFLETLKGFIVNPVTILV
jgi:pyruvate dehydrogenase E2 component (dihydrolipoamide acetyltransferase)